MSVFLTALAVITAFALLAWMVSLPLRNVSIVDSLWSLFFVVAASVYFTLDGGGTRATLVMALVVIWAVRLSLYITVRNQGHGEDYRYQTIRANNEPNFELKSLYIVFGLQGLLAWIISAPLQPAIASAAPLGLLDYVAVALWTVGFVFEAGGDYQLSRFKTDPANAGKVMNKGLWHYTRHPNYFGNCCIWWAFWLFAVPAGGWWTVFAPIIMTLLLLKVSGVAMLERTITERRPEYAEYIRTTNAFVPGPPKQAQEVVL